MSDYIIWTSNNGSTMAEWYGDDMVKERFRQVEKELIEKGYSIIGTFFVEGGSIFIKLVKAKQ